MLSKWRRPQFSPPNFDLGRGCLGVTFDQDEIAFREYNRQDGVAVVAS